MANPTGPGYPSGTNTYIPSDLSARFRVGFSRNPKLFKLTQYTQYVESPTMVGYWLKMSNQEAVRIVTQADFAWPIGTPDKMDSANTEPFSFIPFTTQRNRYGFRIGQETAAQAAWDVTDANLASRASQLMTARTLRLMNVATNTANWAQSADIFNLSSNHYATATAISSIGTVGGGTFDTGTSTLPYMLEGFNAAASLINMDTLGVIDNDPRKFMVVMNPITARQVAASAEMHDYVARSPWAKQERDDGASPNSTYGLPDSIYGYKLVVENANYISSRKYAVTGSTSPTKTYCMPNNTILMLSRVGEIEGIYGAPSFSTLTMFWHRDEFTMETQNSEWDRLIQGKIVENTAEVLTCPQSGFLITNATQPVTTNY